MGEKLTLIGFGPSVYTWVVRWALAELKLYAAYVETNPFAASPDTVLARYTRFDRVPVLQDGHFILTETAAILRYINDVAQAELVPKVPKAAARMAQVIGIADADVYPILVRQVFSHGFYLQSIGQEGNEAILKEGLRRAPPALQTLDQIAAEGLQLDGDMLSLADLHLGPMISYFARVPAGARMLRDYPALARWWARLARRPALQRTDPFAAEIS
ncbi:MAG: glutathione S-transferase family protein [Pseudomonadota bacterium]